MSTLHHTPSRSSTGSINKDFTLARSVSFDSFLSTQKMLQRISNFLKATRGKRQRKDSAAEYYTLEIGDNTQSIQVNGVNFDLVSIPPSTLASTLASKQLQSPPDTGQYRFHTRGNRLSTESRPSESCYVRLSDSEMVPPHSKRRTSRQLLSPQSVEGSNHGDSESNPRSPRSGYEVFTSRYIRVDGVDFEIVTPPTSSTLEWLQTTEEYAEDREYSPHDSSMYHLFKRRYSIRDTIQACCTGSTVDPLDKQELRRKLDTEHQFLCWRAAWDARLDSDTLHRPGSIYEEMMEIDQEITTLMKENIYNLNPGRPLVSKDIFRAPFEKSIKNYIEEEALESSLPPSPSQFDL